MKTRHSYFRAIVLFLSLLGATAMACPDCGGCKTWNSSTGTCDWDCGPSGYCCGHPGSQSCCNNSGAGCCENGVTCLLSTENCCANSPCSNECCNNNTCCPSSTDKCCGTQCVAGTAMCCGVTECGRAYTECCGILDDRCCESECCNSTMCCGAIGELCCEDTACYDNATEYCCEDGLGTFCDTDRECCDGTCCQVGESCCDGECTDVCWTTEFVSGHTDWCGCSTGICTESYVEWLDKDLCVPAGTGVSGHCKCIEKTEVVEKWWDCEGDWDLEALADCATLAGICSLQCLLAPIEPSSCADCLNSGDADCCGGDGCTLCDFRDCHKEDGTLEPFTSSVFDRFEGDTCND